MPSEKLERDAEQARTSLALIQKAVHRGKTLSVSDLLEPWHDNDQSDYVDLSNEISESVEDELKNAVLEQLENGPATVDELVDNIEVADYREQVRWAVRRLFQDGEIVETPDWKYRIQQ